MTEPTRQGKGTIAAVALSVLAAAGLLGCAPSEPVVFGDADHGKIVILRDACGSCHAIPGISLADGAVGPPLAGFGQRTMIAGVLPNTPANLEQWLRDPQRFAPGSAMPADTLNDQEARDAAAYLESLGSPA